MNEKLNKLIRDFLIALSIGFIISGISGAFIPKNSFYYLSANGKNEVSQYEYQGNKSDDPFYTKESTFNKDIALPAGLVSTGFSFLLLTALGTITKSKKQAIS